MGVSVPVDLAASSVAMEAISRRPYMIRFLRSLIGKVEEKAERFGDVGDLGAIRAARTFRQFDGAFTAPIHGFESAEDYWARASALPGLADITVPTLLLNALDDPFLGATCYPTDVAATNPALTLLAPRFGGHVGFMAEGASYWSESTVGRFLDGVFETSNGAK
jgi:predicted alpha/beta-fold hydrolase